MPPSCWVLLPPGLNETDMFGFISDGSRRGRGFGALDPPDAGDLRILAEAAEVHIELIPV